MSAHVATTTTSHPATGATTPDPTNSYAHAVLNFKSDKENGSNKENIEEPSNEQLSKSLKPNTIQQDNSQSSLKEVQSGETQDEGGSFTQVISHSRKERKYEKKKDKNRETHSNKPVVNGNSEKRDNCTTPQTPQEKSKEKEAAPETKKVFVEAPLPKINPWQVNKVKEVQLDKRILQPHKQDAAINGQTSPAVVRAPKDRRKYNQKVSTIDMSIIC